MNDNKIAIKELKRLIRKFTERPGGACYSERMEGAADARHELRTELRARIRLLSGYVPKKGGGA